MNPRDLPLDRLATADRKGNRIFLHPTEVKGRYRNRRSALAAFLIILFLALPWLKIGGHQAVLLNIPERRFALFGLTFWAHDAPLLVFILGGALLLLALATALWGRIWCGWGCPQTVFVDNVFRKIEFWIEGDSLSRKRLDAAPMSGMKFLKRALKWSAFTLCALVISHSFLAYFIGTEALASMMASAPARNPAPFLVMSGITAVVLFDFGWFREQFCTLVCPYGRFQSVLMDDQSQVVAYDVKRGEPRRALKPAEAEGDCVNCYRCVQVCPTGIDIRRGLQLECVACTACMDACDDVMTRLKKPPGLIRYGIQAEKKLRWFQRPRAVTLLALLTVCALGLFFIVKGRRPVELALIRAVDAPYQVLPGAGSGAEVINHFKADLRNQTFEARQVSFVVPASWRERGVSVVVSHHLDAIASAGESTGGAGASRPGEGLAPGESERADVFVRFPQSLLRSGRAEVELELVSGDFIEKQEVRLVGPFQ